MAARTLGIEDHAMLSDCTSAALVASDGAVAWWPSPRFDGPSAFSRLLDRDAGHFTIAPVAAFTSSRRYLPDTLVLETTMRTSSGTVELTDALAFEQGARGHEIGLRSPHALLRVVACVQGSVELELRCEPRLEYGRVVPRWSGEAGAVVTIGGPERLRLAGEVPLAAEGGSAGARFTLVAGQRAGFVLQRLPGIHAQGFARLDPAAALADTVEAWRSWCRLHEGYEGEHRDHVLLARLVLQGLTYGPSGALVAAPTTSLPEIAGGDSNFDYRYGWLRDAAMIARALSAASCADESRRYFDWIWRAALGCHREPRLQPVFGVEGERDLDERPLDHLAGFAGSRPVRIGNAAWRQTQLDVLGEVVDCASELGDTLDLHPFAADFLVGLVDRAAREWTQTDVSIWEGREGERHYLASKLFCWVALDRGVRLAERLGVPERRGRWSRARDDVRAAVLSEGWCERRRAFGGAFGSDHLDASALLLPLVGLLPADDPRMGATVAAIEEELGEDGLVRRWSGAEDGAFLLASFWLAECHARAGRLDRAEAVFERACAGANEVGLLAEEVDPASGRQLGNFPQALSHVGVINAASTITDVRAGRAGPRIAG